MKAIALISGGFHSAGIVSLLREKNLDYVVVAPRITRLVEDSPYLALMNNPKFRPVFSEQMAIAYPSYTMIELLDRAFASEFEEEAVDALIAAYFEAFPGQEESVFSDWRSKVSASYKPLIDRAKERYFSPRDNYQMNISIKPLQLIFLVYFLNLRSSFSSNQPISSAEGFHLHS